MKKGVGVSGFGAEGLAGSVLKALIMTHSVKWANGSFRRLRAGVEVPSNQDPERHRHHGRTPIQ